RCSALLTLVLMEQRPRSGLVLVPLNWPSGNRGFPAQILRPEPHCRGREPTTCIRGGKCALDRVLLASRWPWHTRCFRVSHRAPCVLRWQRLDRNRSVAWTSGQTLPRLASFVSRSRLELVLFRECHLPQTVGADSRW